MMYVPSNSPSMYEVTMEGIELNSSDSAFRRVFLRRREKEENAKPIKNPLGDNILFDFRDATADRTVACCLIDRYSISAEEANVLFCGPASAKPTRVLYVLHGPKL